MTRETRSPGDLVLQNSYCEMLRTKREKEREVGRERKRQTVNERGSRFWRIPLLMTFLQKRVSGHGQRGSFVKNERHCVFEKFKVNPRRVGRFGEYRCELYCCYDCIKRSIVKFGDIGRFKKQKVLLHLEGFDTDHCGWDERDKIGYIRVSAVLRCLQRGKRTLGLDLCTLNCSLADFVDKCHATA